MRAATRIALAVALLVLLASPAVADSYMLFDDWGGTWYDAEKDTTSAEDDLLCWAASASNMLQWTGWGHVDGLTDEDAMLDVFEDHWTDVAGHPLYALDWWFDGTNDSAGWAGWAQVDVPGGGYFPSVTVGDVLEWRGTAADAMDSIDELLHDGYATSVWVGGGGHFVTVWGYEYDVASGDYLGVYVTDSDDDKGGPPPRPDQLQYYDVTWYSATSQWGLEDYYGSDAWRMGGVTGLLQRPAVIPEPTTIALFGLAGAGLAVVRRRRRT